MVNLTILLQMIHFAVTYQLLYHIFLKDGLAFVRRRAQHRAFTYRRIAQAGKEVQELEQAQEAQWQNCVQALSQEKPDLMEVAYRFGVHESEVTIVRDFSYEEVVHELSDQIIKRVDANL